MRGKDHAGIHTGRNDRNGRPRGSRRRTSLVEWRTATAAENEDNAARCKAARVERIKALWAEAEARDQSLDGVHPDET